jgi:hypothetical protein
MNNEPSTTEEIPPLCKATFVSISKGLAILYVAAGIAVAGATTAVGYAITQSTIVATIKEQTEQNKTKIDKLDAEINQKLDILIKRNQ